MDPLEYPSSNNSTPPVTQEMQSINSPMDITPMEDQTPISEQTNEIDLPNEMAVVSTESGGGVKSPPEPLQEEVPLKQRLRRKG